jgi:hypothetical protein
VEKKAFGVAIWITSMMVDVKQWPRILITRDDILGSGEKSNGYGSLKKTCGQNKKINTDVGFVPVLRRGMSVAGLRISYFKYQLFITMLMRCTKGNSIAQLHTITSLSPVI